MSRQNSYWNKKILYWKEEIVRRIRSFFVCRASARASLTVEMALVIPIFLFGVAALCFRIEVDTIDRGVRSALLSTGKVMAQDGALNEKMSLAAGKLHLIRTMKKQGTRTDFIVGGPYGVCLGKSVVDDQTDIIELVGIYLIRIPGMRNFPLKRETKARVKMWTGFVSQRAIDEKEQMVYVTRKGYVYHVTTACRHLNRTVQTVKKENIAQARNASGGKYAP